MTARRPLTLISGVTTELPVGDTVAGVSAGTLVAGSGLDGGGALDGGTVTVNASIAPAASGLIFVGDALGIDGSATASGNAALADAATALASGNAGILDAGVALASGNAALVDAGVALASGNAALVDAGVALASGNAALVDAGVALASGNAALTDVSGKYDKSGGPISGSVTVQSQSIGSPTYVNSSGVCILNFGAGNNFEVVLTAATSTFATPVNASGGQTGTITLRQDGTGSRLVAYSGAWSFASDTPPTLTTTASGVDFLAFYCANPSRILTVATLNYGSGTVA